MRSDKYGHFIQPQAQQEYEAERLVLAREEECEAENRGMESSQDVFSEV